MYCVGDCRDFAHALRRYENDSVDVGAFFAQYLLFVLGWAAL